MGSVKLGEAGERGLWVPVSPSDVSNWRKATVDRVGKGGRVHRHREVTGMVVGRGGEYEMQRFHTDQADPTRHEGNAALVDRPDPIRGIREARDTVQILASDMLAWVREVPELYEERVKHIVGRAKAMGALGHLTDEEAAQQVHVLAQKLAVADAEKGYAKGGHNRAVIVDGRF